MIEAALEMRARLAAIGLESFCKTTGGKGLHVVTPLAQPRNTHLDWPLVKAFAREVCRQMAADKPDRYLINMSKSAPKGLIFSTICVTIACRRRCACFSADPSWGARFNARYLAAGPAGA